jgi:SPP1 gp7 family putative phage head morphogenesis protein
MTSSVNAAILDRAIKHGVFLERYKTSVANQIIGFLNDEVLPSILAQIQKRLSTFESRGFDLGPGSTNRLQLMDTAIKDILQEGTSIARGMTREDLVGLAKQEGEFSAGLFNALTPTMIDFTLPSASLLRAIVTQRPFGGAMLTPWFDKMKKDTAGQVMRAIRAGIATGQTTGEIVSAIRGTRANGFKDGIFDITRRSADALVRTAAASVATQARDEVFNENAELLDGEQWVATLDDRTCPECAALDGVVMDLGDGDRPPLHVGCRCFMVPVVKSWRALGIDKADLPESTRASMDGQVPESVTYGDWLADQSYDTQVAVLGQTRADLFASGELDIKQFVNDRGELMTLDELRAAEPDAFATVEGRQVEAPEVTKYEYGTNVPSDGQVEYMQQFVDALPDSVKAELEGWNISAARDRRGLIRTLGVKDNTQGITSFDKASGDKRIIVFQYTGANRDTPNTDMQGTLYHEVGHAVDVNALFKNDARFSSQADFMKAFRADMAGIKNLQSNKPGEVARWFYFVDDPREAFAEGFGHLLVDPSKMTGFQREFERAFPNVNAWMRDHMDALLSGPVTPAAEISGATVPASVEEMRLPKIPPESDQFWASKAIEYKGKIYQPTKEMYDQMDISPIAVTHADIEKYYDLPFSGTWDERLKQTQSADGFIGWDGKFYTRQQMSRLSDAYVQRYGVPKGNTRVDFSEVDVRPASELAKFHGGEDLAARKVLVDRTGKGLGVEKFSEVVTTAMDDVPQPILDSIKGYQVQLVDELTTTNSSRAAAGGGESISGFTDYRKKMITIPAIMPDGNANFSAGSTLYHELGHAFWNLNLDKAMRDEFNTVLEADYVAAKVAGKLTTKMEQGMLGYFTLQPGEMFAELFGTTIPGGKYALKNPTLVRLFPNTLKLVKRFIKEATA